MRLHSVNQLPYHGKSVTPHELDQRTDGTLRRSAFAPRPATVKARSWPGFPPRPMPSACSSSSTNSRKQSRMNLARPNEKKQTFGV